jgi:hypothetical protein
MSDIRNLYDTEVIDNNKFNLGLNSNKYGISDEDVNSKDYSTGTIIPVKLNNKGFATMIIYPHFLISQNMLDGFHLGSKKNVSNIFIANEDNKTHYSFNKTISVPSPSVTDFDFDTYRVQKWEVRCNYYNGRVVPMKETEPYDEENYIHFKVIDGKAINALADNNLYFSNPLMATMLIEDSNLVQEYIGTLGATHRYFCSDQKNMGEFKYNKNGYNNTGQVPINVSSDEKVYSNRVAKYMDYVGGGEDKYDENFLENIPSVKEMNRKVDYVSSVVTYGSTGTNIFDNNNQMNDKVIKIELKGEPYFVIDIMVNFYFTIKTDLVKEGNLGRNNVYDCKNKNESRNKNSKMDSMKLKQQWHPQIRYPSQNDKDLTTAIKTTREENNTMDGELIAEDILVGLMKQYNMLTQDEIEELNSIGDWFKKAWNKTKEVAVKVKDAVVDFIKPKTPLEAAGEIITTVL